MIKMPKLPPIGSYNNKYVWTLLAFVIVAGFLDENSLWRLHELRSTNHDLREEIAIYEDDYASSQDELQRLGKSPDAFEEVARVRLGMKSDDEDVYIIE